MSLPVSCWALLCRTTLPEPEPPELAPNPLEELPEAGAGAGTGPVPENGIGNAPPRVVRTVVDVVTAVTKWSRSEESSLAEKRGSVRT